ncbi:hypothetical protein B0H19DRAFT_1200189 [Mycena capillaripes]|nr:hypothetical protein B0H19DRAFT_1200189 [Mycena capillaripes]
MDCQFSFGPNGAFFCKSDTIWAWSDNNTLPEPLRLILEDPNHPQANKFPYDVAFPMEPGMFMMSWKTKNNEDYYEELFLGPRYAKLAEYMRNLAQSGEHTTRTVFGPNASYFTCSPSGFSWQHLPAVLEQNIIGHMKKGLPTNVALGVQGAFCVLYSDGNVVFDVATHYPAVDAMIRNSVENARRKGIAFIALSPHAAGQYYVAYGDGSASWNLPNEWSVDVTTVSKSLRAVGSARMASTTGGFAAPQSPASPSTLSTGLHAAGKLWHAYQNNQQQNSSPFATQTTFFDTSNTSPPSFDQSTLNFDPSSLATGIDPSTLAAGLDPNLVVNTIGALFGNSN